MSSICYYCGNTATTDEHVPPKAIFPEQKDSPDGKDYRKNLKTVPSCHEHNTVRSKDDEYLLYVLAMTITSNKHGHHQFLTKVMRAINRRPALIHQIGANPRNVTVRDSETGQEDNTVVMELDYPRLDKVFKHILKGIYFVEKGTPYPKTVKPFHEFSLSMEDISQNQKNAELAGTLDACFTEFPKIGENPDVFYYKFAETPNGPIARAYFYETTRVSGSFL